MKTLLKSPWLRLLGIINIATCAFGCYPIHEGQLLILYHIGFKMDDLHREVGPNPFKTRSGAIAPIERRCDHDTEGRTQVLNPDSEPK